MNEENTVDPIPEAISTPPVLLAPGHLFFVDRIALPAALESSEIHDFAELSLESLAPFPIEQLYWGYLYSEAAGSVLLYASYKERIKALGYENIESYLWVLPDFATLFGAHFTEATTVQLESEEGCSQITFAAGDSLPEQVISRPPEAVPGETPKKNQLLRLELESTTVSEKGLPTFHFQTIDPASRDLAQNCAKLSPSEEALWRADIREEDFKQNERSTRKLTARISRATVYAASFLLLMLLLEGILFIGDYFWLESQKTKIEAQAPEVSRIEDKQSLMNKLDQVAQNELRPIAILDALNKVRPEGIYFTDAVAEEQNRINIEGIANTISELNAYLEALTASGHFELIDSDRVTRGGKTTFSATLDYIHTNNLAGSEEERSS